jgi:hypothetical protein
MSKLTIQKALSNMLLAASMVLSQKSIRRYKTTHIWMEKFKHVGSQKWPQRRYSGMGCCNDFLVWCYNYKISKARGEGGSFQRYATYRNKVRNSTDVRFNRVEIQVNWISMYSDANELNFNIGINSFEIQIIRNWTVLNCNSIYFTDRSNDS